MKNGFYVYRFKNENKQIVYVGKAANLEKRFKNHEHLTEDVKIIEYIECGSEAEQAWKEIYYINLFYNELSTNVADVYRNGEMSDIGLSDKWITYKNKVVKNILTDDIINQNYDKYILHAPKYDYKSLINIFDNYKMNIIGEDIHALSQHWFELHKNDNSVKKLKNNTINYFNNILKSKSKNNIWTTYWNCKDLLSSKGYAKGFVDDTYNKIDFADRNNVAYLKNVFYSLSQTKEITVDENIYAISDLIKFLFTTDLSYGKPINIYIPSKRMRELLIKWINEQNYGDIK